MDFEYDGDEDLGGRILWGRIAVFGAALLLALLLGRCTAGGGADPAELEALQARVTEDASNIEQLNSTIQSLQQRVVDLQNQLDAAGAGGGLPTDTGTEAAGGTEDGTADGGLTETPDGQIYVVQPGDTLSGIAANVYGDPTAFGPIAEANGITEQNPLQVGQELIIPPNPDA